MPNILPLSYATTTAQALSNLILVSPRQVIGYQPKNKKFERNKEPPALLFTYEGENTFELECDITDHYVENNIAVQDQIAVKPEIVTVHGFIGELNNQTPEALKYLRLATEKLVTIGAYVPQLSLTALVAYNIAFQGYQAATRVVDSAVNAWASVTGKDGLNVIDNQGISGFDPASGQISGTQNRQQVAFQQFYGYMRQRTLFRVQTPWCVVDDMVIQKIRAVQSEETRVVTDFFITFKKIRFTSTQTTQQLDAVHQTRSRAQAAEVTNIGPNQATPSIGLDDALAGVA